MRSRFEQTRGFNLLELLATIAIIAVLAALLLPLLSRAKNQAAKATDLNNLRQERHGVDLEQPMQGTGSADITQALAAHNCTPAGQWL